MDDLVAWLRAQLDEDERMTRAGGDAMDYDHPAYPDYRTYTDEDTERADAYLGRFKPRRMLSEIEAKRRILDEYEAARSRYLVLADARARSLALTKPEPNDEERRAIDMADAYARAVRLLALPCADRPGYLDVWRLDTEATKRPR